ncbi:UNVERIFIED_CONTAM: hypothetical protein FKN15_042063 [Acipenser sinensis]
MGHLLSKNGKRVKKRKRKLRRNCFLHGPCMLCFIVHSNANSRDENQLESASKLAERYATLSTTEDCAKFLLSPKELWEEQGKCLLSSVPAKFIGPQLFRTVSTEYSEMVCKRKCGGAQKCTPCKQPRCTFQEVTENGLVSDPAAQCHIHLCSLPSSSSSSSSSTECSGVGLQVDLGEGSTTTNQGSSVSSELAPQKNLQEFKVFETDVSNVNLLPSSILLKHLSTTSSTASSCDTDFTKDDEQRLKDYIQQLKNDRAAVKLTMLELESIQIDPLSYDVKPRGDSQRLDLENAVLMQELMAMKEEMAELKAQLYLLEKEKKALELKLSTREAQEQAYLVHIEHLKSEVEEHNEQRMSLKQTMVKVK